MKDYTASVPTIKAITKKEAKHSLLPVGNTRTESHGSHFVKTGLCTLNKQYYIRRA